MRSPEKRARITQVETALRNLRQQRKSKELSKAEFAEKRGPLVLEEKRLTGRGRLKK